MRYFRPMVYGNYTTLVFDDIDPEKTYVSQLKRKIFIKMRVDPKFQKLTIRQSGESQTIIDLKNENTISAYNLNDCCTIILENLSSVANQEHAHSEEFVCKTDVSETRSKLTPRCPFLPRLGRP